MKRKLNEDDVPTPVDPPVEEQSSNSSELNSSFETLNLDSRLLQAISKQNFTKPTPVQAETIPLALQGKDVLARARTGSGKTAAYVLPALQSILHQKLAKSSNKAVRALFLVPTKELAQQITKVTGEFCAFCAKDVRVLNLNKAVSDTVQRSLLADCPEVIVATPAKAWSFVASAAMSLESLLYLVIDEADLVLSYGHSEDLRNLSRSLPGGVQTILTSATLSDEVDQLTKDFCKDPVVLALDEKEDDKSKVKQYVTKCGEDEKFLYLFVIMKLKLIKGKTIIFVEDIDRSYRVKLYLEQFGIRACVLNSELPVNSRIHVVEEFNKGVYDIIIASDEHEVTGGGLRQAQAESRKRAAEKEGDDWEDEEDEEADPEPKKKKRKSSKQDKEYGISRGIDFKNVACVLNFDLPRSSKSYTHRIGRTARAGKTGMALSFMIPRDQYRKHKYASIPSTQHDEQVLTDIIAHQAKKGSAVEPYPFDPEKIASFRYRSADALRAVTTVAVREARTKELRNEIIKSDKLKRHFEENPEDLHHLRHDHELRAARVQDHLKHVPDYLLPDGGAKAVGAEIGHVGLGRTTENRIRRNRRVNLAKGRGRIAKTKRSDPLKTFNAKGRGKK